MRLFVVRLLWPVFFMGVFGVLSLGCTPSPSKSKVKIQLPIFSKSIVQPSAVTTDGDSDGDGSPWSGSVSSAQELNCYVVMIGGSEAALRRNSCYENESDALALRFGRFIGGVPEGKSIEIDLLADQPRRMILLGMKSESGYCKDFTGDGPEDGKLSHPRVLYDKVHTFKSGSQELTMAIPMDLTGSTEIDRCEIAEIPDTLQPDPDPGSPLLPTGFQRNAWDGNISLGDNSLLGHDVASAGNTFVVGAPGDGLSGFSGAVYASTWNGSQWVHEKLNTPAAVVSDTSANFGYSVDTDGNTIIVGAPGLSSDSGGAFLYRYSTLAKSWNALPIIDLGSGLPGSRKGKSVAVQGDLAVAGAPFTSALGRAYGSAFYYKNTGVRWSSFSETNIVSASLTSSTNHGSLADPNDEWFGYSVAISPNGRYVAVGAPHYETNASRTDEGVVFVLEFDQNNALVDDHLVLPNGAVISNTYATNLYFGRNVDISNVTLVSGNHDYFAPPQDLPTVVSLSVKSTVVTGAIPPIFFHRLESPATTARWAPGSLSWVTPLPWVFARATPGKRAVVFSISINMIVLLVAGCKRGPL